MSTLVLDKVSRWFGNVVAVNDVTMTIGPGVTGLLGPNGAGKTTLMAMMSGFLPPSSGTVALDGEPVWRHTEAYRRIGLVPERELSFGYLTGRQFVRANADLHALPEAAADTESILEVVRGLFAAVANFFQLGIDAIIGTFQGIVHFIEGTLGFAFRKSHHPLLLSHLSFPCNIYHPCMPSTEISQLTKNTTVWTDNFFLIGTVLAIWFGYVLYTQRQGTAPISRSLRQQKAQ